MKLLSGRWREQREHQRKGSRAGGDAALGGGSAGFGGTTLRVQMLAEDSDVELHGDAPQ